MFFDKQISRYIINKDKTLLEGLKMINEEKGRVLFLVNTSARLHSVLTNGDIFRWILSSENPDLNTPLEKVGNKQFISFTESSPRGDIREALKKVLFIPILDKNNHIVAVARRDTPKYGISIGDFTLSEEGPAFVIAEIGNNHNGSFELACRLVDEAKAAGANCAKFQLRNIKSLYHNAGNPDDPSENLSSQYTLDLLSRFQLSMEDQFRVFDYCKEVGIEPLCTPWDSESLKVLEKYGMKAYKVASADLTNHDLLTEICHTRKPIICSTGMSTEREIKETVELFKKEGAPYVLLHCNSTYPAPFQDINLAFLPRLKEIGDCMVGYSGHERDIFVSVAAIALGAKVIERHITVDRNMEGNDHKASLLPGEFKRMIEGIRQVEESMGVGDARVISQGELMNRANLSKSLIINQALKKGTEIEASMIDVKSPGKGLQPNYKHRLIGTKAKRDYSKGDFFYPSDLEEDIIESRPYHFSRPWGIPVRYHDYKSLMGLSNPDLLEFHLSYKDLELQLDQFFDQKLPIDLVVHTPELFKGDHTLDLCSLDEGYRKQSIAELQNVINITRELAQYFDTKEDILMVTNVGGFTTDGFLSESERKQRIDLLKASLSALDTTGVEIIPQTMPPFPWHFGGQQFHNLFVHSEEIVEFCKDNNYRICLDTSHSKLACNHYKIPFSEFMKAVAPYTAHIHFADSSGTGQEGLQIGEGDIDFGAIFSIINDHCPQASFIPEIWQGHENNGEGFWIAMERIEAAADLVNT